MDIGTAELVARLFGPLAAVAIGLYFVFGYLKRQNEKQQDQIDDLVRQRIADKDALIKAFGDIGDAFERFATDVKELVTKQVVGHEHNAAKRQGAILDRMEQHKALLLDKLDEFIRRGHD